MPFGLSDLQFEKMIHVFAANKEVNEVILYGSRAKESYKQYSDIDITLLGDGITFSVLQKIEIELDDLFLPYKFDVSLYHSIENPDLVNHIQSVGKTIYKKEL
jgi:predicted nucleotidyltransferase